MNMQLQEMIREQKDTCFDNFHAQPPLDAFICPLSKHVMQDPVIIENGQTFERKEIEMHFKESENNVRRIVCPVTLWEIKTTTLIPNITICHAIEEWYHRKEIAQLNFAVRTLSDKISERDICLALEYVMNISKTSSRHKRVVREANAINGVIDMLKFSSRTVRCRALETLRAVVEDDDDNKEIMATEETIRTIVKFLQQGLLQEKEEAISLLYELSKSNSISEKIGRIHGAILIIIGLTTSRMESISTVEKAEGTLVNLESCEQNVMQMADNGRLQPLLNLFLTGAPETQLSMVSHLGKVSMSNDLKVVAAQRAGTTIVGLMRNESMMIRLAAIKALIQISSYEPSATILLENEVLPPLVQDLFSTGREELPLSLIEDVSVVLANIVISGADFNRFILGNEDDTLASEETVAKLLHVVRTYNSAIACKILEVLVVLTSSHATVHNVVSAVKKSYSITNLIEFIGIPEKDLEMASIELLRNISLYMNQELVAIFFGNDTSLARLINVISENAGISKEQAVAIEILARIVDESTPVQKEHQILFDMLISQILKIQRKEIGGGCYLTPYLEGLVRIVYRLTCHLEREPYTQQLALRYTLGTIFADLIQSNGLDYVQIVSAMALENLSRQSKHLSRTPMVPPLVRDFTYKWYHMFLCFSNGKSAVQARATISNICPIHRGICSMSETFCLFEGNLVERLLSYLDHRNHKFVEAVFATLCTLLDDGVDIDQGVLALRNAGGITSMMQILHVVSPGNNRPGFLRAKVVWAVERILRTEDIAREASRDQRIGGALIDAYRHGDEDTREIAQCALTHMDKIQKFSRNFT